MNKYLVVGAGFTGSTIARMLADEGKSVDVFESRHHVGGNAFDEYNERGILIHPYGPHIFHTNSKKVFDFLSRFTNWVQYEHEVQSFVNDLLVDFPINIHTVNTIYDLKIKTAEELEAFFQTKKVNHKKISNSRQYVESKIGEELCNLFFTNYTKKHWGLDLADLSVSVAARIPYRTNFDRRYFEDKYQYMPANGYHILFKNMLEHRNININLNVPWYPENQDLENYNHVFYTGEIDKYFNHKFGKLEYRSVDFIHQTFDIEEYQSAATVNYPNNHDYTRITEFKKLTGQVSSETSIVKEIPTIYGDPYYPVPTEKNRLRYNLYEELAIKQKNVSFCGRLGGYKYLNMDQAVGAGMSRVKRILNPAIK